LVTTAFRPWPKPLRSNRTGPDDSISVDSSIHDI